MIELERVTKRFGQVTAVDEVSLSIPEGKVCVLLGPSGCGKTTTLKMINRLIPKSSGRIVVAGRDVDAMNQTTLRRSIGYVIQQVGLFPNMTVAQNIAVVPRMMGWSKPRIAERTREMLGLVSLDPDTFLGRFPRELSGGQAQRVGVARALAADPPVLLMDEPFGAIDPIARQGIHVEFMALQARLRKTVIIVSHDVDEATRLGDLIAIFRDGRLVQYDTPERLLARPADKFVAEFFHKDRAIRRLGLVRVADLMEPLDPGNLGGPALASEESARTALSLLLQAPGGRMIVTGDDGAPVGTVSLAGLSAYLTRSTAELEREPP